MSTFPPAWPECHLQQSEKELLPSLQPTNQVETVVFCHNSIYSVSFILAHILTEIRCKSNPGKVKLNILMHQLVLSALSLILGNLHHFPTCLIELLRYLLKLTIEVRLQLMFL